MDPSGKGNVNLLKAWQISYLKNLQAADLERRRNRSPTTNEMFLAYEVRKTEGMAEVLSQPLLMDEELEGAYNLNANTNANANANNNNNDGITDESSENCYVRGDLLGFVEVTQRPYGLGGAAAIEASLLEGNSLDDAVDDNLDINNNNNNNIDNFIDMNNSNSGGQSSQSMRPVLTNLAVLKESRKYGIGSKLLDACEEHVLSIWKMNEIVLEVEDYNDSGLEFYQRRGYEVLFSDPASRRYDIKGFWLNKVRCRRDIMRKSIQDKPNPNSLMKSADNFLSMIRDSVGIF